MQYLTNMQYLTKLTFLQCINGQIFEIILPFFLPLIAR